MHRSNLLFVDAGVDDAVDVPGEHGAGGKDGGIRGGHDRGGDCAQSDEGHRLRTQVAHHQGQDQGGVLIPDSIIPVGGGVPVWGGLMDIMDYMFLTH